MTIFNMYVSQCILCASERKCFRIYGALQIKIIIIIISELFQEHSGCNSGGGV